MPRRADHDSICDRCNRIIQRGSPLLIWHDKWIHPTCAPGGDDE